MLSKHKGKFIGSKFSNASALEQL